MSRAVEMLLDRVMKTMETISLPGKMLPLNIYNGSNGNGVHDENKGRVKLENVSEDDEDANSDDQFSNCRC